MTDSSRQLGPMCALLVIGFTACGSSAPASLTHPGEATQPVDVTEVRRQLLRAGSIFLAIGNECLEWSVKDDGKTISLTRLWFPLKGTQRVRHRQRRLLRVTRAGLSLDPTIHEEHAQLVAATGRWRATTGAIWSSLCAHEPSLEIVKVNHYRIGGAELFLTRRTCEESRRTQLATCKNTPPKPE